MVVSYQDKDNSQEDRMLDELAAKAVEAAAKGENVEQLLELMLVSLPVAQREKLRKIFVSALARRGLRPPSGEADIPSRAALSRMRTALAVSARQMAERVMQLVRRRPDLAASIKEAGEALLKNGVRNDPVPVSEADLGTLSPATSAAKPQQERGGRSA